MDSGEAIEAKFRALSGRLDEATLRLWAAVEAHTLGRGGVSTVAKAVGMSRTTIYAGLRELAIATSSGDASPRTDMNRVRARGGGRKRLTDKDPALLRDLDALVEPTTRGDPQSPLRWTCKSTPRLAKELVARYCWKPEITSMMTMSTKNMPHSLRDTRILSSCMVISESTGRLSRPCS